MSINNKYTKEERKIAREIHILQNRQRELMRQWHENDIKIILLKQQLQGKYNERRFIGNND